jgi:hypothetical protein
MRLNKYLLGVVFLMTSLRVVATEFRSPLIVERGPMRYVFEEWEEKDYGLKLWSSVYCREAHKAFLNHGTNTTHLSALFFNKSDFKLGEIFPGGHADLATENYSPFVALGKMQPRVTYYEKGFSLGGRFAYPVYKNKGRIGLRVQIPFRKIEIEKEDPGDLDTNQLDDFMTGEVVTRAGATGGSTDVWARAVRMDFVQAIPATATKTPLLNFTAAGIPQIIGDNATWGIIADDRMTAVIHSPEGTIPSGPTRLIGICEDPIPTLGIGANLVNVANRLPANGNISDATQYVFYDTTNYTPLNINTGTDAAKLAALDKTDDLWLTSVHNDNVTGGEEFNTGSEKLWTALDLALKNYNENMYEWLENNDFLIQTERRCGLGDIDLDLFYEHKFSDEFIGEAMVGVRFPTGPSDNYAGSVYRPHLGNGEHFEIKLGLMGAWQPVDWMNIKLDGRFAFVLEATEKRAAAFTGALIKNIGPAVDADVSWEYVVATLDFNLFHPKTDAISSVIGYEFYYKTKDDIDFKTSSMQSWLGQKFVDGAWTENKHNLDSNVAEKHTEAFGHKVRFETSFRINQYFELYCGGTYTFAGQNLPRECDGHGGFVVTF